MTTLGISIRRTLTNAVSILMFLSIAVFSSYIYFNFLSKSPSIKDEFSSDLKAFPNHVSLQAVGSCSSAPLLPRHCELPHQVILKISRTHFILFSGEFTQP